MQHIRPAVLAGTWYSDRPDTLAASVANYVAAADPKGLPEGRPLLAVVPHAGHVYSGPTAGRLYGLLRDLDYDRIFILAPSHRTHLPRIALPGTSAFATPLGTVPVDEATVAKLAGGEAFDHTDSAHAEEHAVEIQLPFIQECFGATTPIVPLLVPQLPDELRRAAAEALAPWTDGRSLFLVSTDFTHYGAAFGYQPFDDDVPERLRRLDHGAIERILAADADGLRDYGRNTGITMCGLHATALALEACGEAIIPAAAGGATLVDYRRSADVEGDFAHSVSYASILMAGRRATAPGKGTLTAAEKTFLLSLARRVVTAVATGEKAPAAGDFAAECSFAMTPALQQKRGAFVTLTRGGRLRGCIGYIEGVEPLADAVARNARSAAARDPRFEPVGPDDVDDLHLEVSALTPLHPVTGPEEIVLGRHGILLRRGGAHSVFLPQVAPEQGWDLETTLSHLALKAGLDADAWRRGAEFLVFEADVFE